MRGWLDRRSNDIAGRKRRPPDASEALFISRIDELSWVVEELFVKYPVVTPDLNRHFIQCAYHVIQTRNFELPVDCYAITVE
jgi:hypothetical protein